MEGEIMGGTSTLICWRQRTGARETVEKVLQTLHASIKELPSQKWNRATSSVSGIRDYKLSYFAPAGGPWITLMLRLNSSLSESLPAALSRSIEGPVIAIHESNRTAWGYDAYERGKLRDKFWNRPDAVDAAAKGCRGDAATVGDLFDVDASRLAPYLQQRTSGLRQGKAFSNDDFPLDDPWVRIDFMRQLGIHYPDPGRTRGGRYLLVNEPGGNKDVPAPARGGVKAGSASTKAKKWWQFWK